MLPAESGTEERHELLGLLRAYDPDVLATHVPLLEDLAHFDEGVIEHAMRWHDNTGVDDPDAWEHMSGEPADPGS
jgi:hypothetical protein